VKPVLLLLLLLLLQVVPSDGLTSVSLWDTVDPAGLQEWLAENLGSDCRTELHEVGLLTSCSRVHCVFVS
jgi:hypothetical protein